MININVGLIIRLHVYKHNQNYWDFLLAFSSNVCNVQDETQRSASFFEHGVGRRNVAEVFLINIFATNFITSQHNYKH